MKKKIAQITLNIEYDSEQVEEAHPINWDWPTLLDMPAGFRVEISSYRDPKYDWSAR